MGDREMTGMRMIQSVGRGGQKGRSNFDPTPDSTGAQAPLWKAHGSEGWSQKLVNAWAFLALGEKPRLRLGGVGVNLPEPCGLGGKPQHRDLGRRDNVGVCIPIYDSRHRHISREVDPSPQPSPRRGEGVGNGYLPPPDDWSCICERSAFAALEARSAWCRAAAATLLWAAATLRACSASALAWAA